MASANKPTAVHFSLVAFVMIAAVCGFMWYMTFKDLNLAKQDLDNAKKASSQDKELATKMINERDLIKKFLGHTFEVTGNEGADETNGTTVLGAMVAELAKYSPDARNSYTAALQKLAEDLRNAKMERDDLSTKLAILNKDYLDVQARETKKLDIESDKVKTTEADLRALATKKDEQLAAKQNEIIASANALVAKDAELNTEKQNHIKEVKDLKQILDQQVILIAKLNEEMDGLKKTSFEVPKGIVRYVDHTGNLVWINLGRDDRLRERTTFSVYVKSNQGMARSSEDIKGAIEVERILGPHLAQARITKSDIYRPIAAGDPVYTPLWNAAGTEKFALIGLMDIDGDKYSDRDALIQTIKLAGAEVAAEVNEKGVRTGVIDQSIKFMVLGKIPKLEDAENKEEKDQLQKMYSEINTARKEAGQNGVRIISLADFANYIGYVNSSKLYRPGDKPVDTLLNEGAHSKGVGANPGQRKSPGKVSDLFEKKDKTKYKPPVSSGTTSKLFKGTR